MQIGAHISIAGGIVNAPENAQKAGCECFQMFSRSPRGGPAPEFTPPIIKEFKARCRQYKLKNYYIHTPYYINLASGNNRIKYGSTSVIREDLERASALGARAVMTHLGSANDLGETKGQLEVIKSLVKVLDGYQGSAQFLIEISAGAGAVIGDSFAEIAEIIAKTEKQLLGKAKKLDSQQRIGVCFDTCHAFASGYDLRNQLTVKKTLAEWDQTIGLERMILAHVNDSKTELGSHVDRHEHIGLGQIGRAGFLALAAHPFFRELDWILETPDDGRADDIQTLREIRKQN